MVEKIFQKNCAYKINDELAYFLSAIDGINIFKLEFDTKLYCFYFSETELNQIDKIDEKKIKIYRNDEIPEPIVKLENKSININQSELLNFIFSARPAFPNAAFCPENLLEELFERKGILLDKKKKIELGGDYRAINPNYCLIKDNFLFRQTDMREKYPDIILEITKFKKDVFLESSMFDDIEKFYLRTKSNERFGGTHKEFADWDKKVIDSFENYFKNYEMGKFKRIFKIKNEKLNFFNENKIDIKKIRLLKYSE